MSEQISKPERAIIACSEASHVDGRGFDGEMAPVRRKVEPAESLETLERSLAISGQTWSRASKFGQSGQTLLPRANHCGENHILIDAGKHI